MQFSKTSKKHSGRAQKAAGLCQRIFLVGALCAASLAVPPPASANFITHAANKVKDAGETVVGGVKVGVDTIKMVKTVIEDIIKLVDAGKDHDDKRAVSVGLHMLQAVRSSKLVEMEIKKSPEAVQGLDIVEDLLKSYPNIEAKIADMVHLAGTKKARQIINGLEAILEVFSKTQLAHFLSKASGAGKSFPEQLMRALKDLHTLADSMEHGVGKVVDAVHHKDLAGAISGSAYMAKSMVNSSLIRKAVDKAAEHSAGVRSLVKTGGQVISAFK